MRVYGMIAAAILACLPAMAADVGPVFGDLASAMAELKFDPRAPGNAVVVLLADPHLNVNPETGTSPTPTTNLNPDVVNVVNAMDPPPARILVAGDIISSYSEVPGYVYSGNWPVVFGLQEMSYWYPALQAFTNVALTNILWVPGNHDQDFRETNADLFCATLGRPPHAAFDLAGVRFLMMNAGNLSEPSEPERAWVREQVAATNPTQTVAVVTHQPPFSGTAIERGTPLFLRELFSDWPSRWYVVSGHAHSQDVSVFNVGRAGVASYVVGSVNTNDYKGTTYHPGFRFLCLSNGLAGTIYYHLNGKAFEVEPPPDWTHPRDYTPPFSQVEGLLWRRFKTGAPLPEVVQVQATDSSEWYAYTSNLVLRLPLANHANRATHFLFLSAGLDRASVVRFSLDRTNWVESGKPEVRGAISSYPIPSDFVSSPECYVWFNCFKGPNNFIAGWGLSTTNSPPYLRYPELQPVAGQETFVGKEVVFTNIALSPYSPPDRFQFRLVSGPEDAFVDPLTGVFRWRPSLIHAGRTFSVRISVSDRDPPLISSTQEVSVSVVRPAGVIVVDAPSLVDGSFQFYVAGDLGLRYNIWASSNLVDWTLVCTTNLTDMPFLFREPADTSAPGRFYRTTTEPL